MNHYLQICLKGHLRKLALEHGHFKGCLETLKKLWSGVYSVWKSILEMAAMGDVPAGAGTPCKHETSVGIPAPMCTSVTPG